MQTFAAKYLLNTLLSLIVRARVLKYILLQKLPIIQPTMLVKSTQRSRCSKLLQLTKCSSQSVSHPFLKRKTIAFVLNTSPVRKIYPVSFCTDHNVILYNVALYVHDRFSFCQALLTTH